MTIDEPYSLAPEEVRDKLPQIERRLAESERYAPLMQEVEWLLDDGHMSQEHLARLRAAFEAA